MGSAASAQPQSQELVRELLDILDGVQQLPNRGEANTLVHVVQPILEALGWPRQLCSHQHRVPPAERADIALLNSEGGVLAFVEVKALDETLSDRDVRQALSYAHGQGVRWALLTNGREWRIYDAHQETANVEKIVASISLEALREGSEEPRSALALLSPRAFEPRGALEELASASKTYRALRELLADEKAMRRALKSRTGHVWPNLGLLLQRVLGLLPAELPAAMLSQPLPSSERVTSRPPPPTRARSRAAAPRSALCVRIARRVWHRQRVKDITRLVAEYLISQGKLTRRHYPGLGEIIRPRDPSRPRYLINTRPHHGKRPFRAPVQLSNGL
jgi:hypothetical protein